MPPAEAEKQLELARKSTAEAQKTFDASLKSPEAIKPSTDATKEPKSEYRYGRALNAPRCLKAWATRLTPERPSRYRNVCGASNSEFARKKETVYRTSRNCSKQCKPSCRRIVAPPTMALPTCPIGSATWKPRSVSRHLSVESVTRYRSPCGCFTDSLQPPAGCSLPATWSSLLLSQQKT